MKSRHILGAVVLSVLIAAGGAAGIWLLDRQMGGSLFAGKVGLVEVRGMIQQPEPVLKALIQFRYDDEVAAVVLRVDSPGGGAAASQEIYREILRLKRVKPVVASLAGVAASGGYYIAAPCSKIVANPATVTGSIGAIATIPDLEKLFAKLGIKLQVVKSGALKGAGQIDRPLNPAERAMIQEAISDTYRQFVSDVAQARGLPLSRVRAIANGGIFTGRRARQYGLVDKLGNLVDAVNLAAKLGGIAGRPALVRPREKERSWWQRLLLDETRALVQELWDRALPRGLMYLYLPAGGG